MTPFDDDVRDAPRPEATLSDAQVVAWLADVRRRGGELVHKGNAMRAIYEPSRAAVGAARDIASAGACPARAEVPSPPRC